MADGDQEIVVGGIYLEVIKSKVGIGDTEKDSAMQNYWLVNSRHGSAVELELLDMNDQPSGYKELMEINRLKDGFIFQPYFEPNKVTPKQQEADRLAARGERHLEKQEYHSAEYEFKGALKLDQKNVRAGFGLGKTHLALGEEDKARELFKGLTTNEQMVDPRHKHIFNEFGIQLRKLGMYEEAVYHYRRAIKLSPDDEHLWFNMGRALCEGGSRETGISSLKKALSLRSDFEEAKNYLANLSQQG
ncbi:MAG: tetratricopeptide repeat protein [Deltaproteobacteria bacterium]|nr:tetratricopeptide repeat protein [Deltaproteobacteria bacterium]